jgi:Fur family ferric uptake transcriptional regulator
MKGRASEMAHALRAHGYKLTAQRLAVLEVLQSGEPHLSPAEVHERGQAIHPRLGLTTVYRTLEILARLGFLHRPRMGDNAGRYSTCVDGHHSHLVCCGCGLVIEFTECYADGLAQRLVDETDFRIDSHLLEFIGLCPDCQKDPDIDF